MEALVLIGILGAFAGGFFVGNEYKVDVDVEKRAKTTQVEEAKDEEVKEEKESDQEYHKEKDHDRYY